MKKHNVCIFDLDGTLFDSMGIWTLIDIDFLAKRGISVPKDYTDVVSTLCLTEAAKYTIERFGLDEKIEDLVIEWKEMARHAYGHTVQMKPYAKEYLHELKRRGVKLGVATSLPRALSEAALINHNILSLFDAVCTTDDVSCGKTKPDLFLFAANKLGVLPEECIMYDDMPHAIKTAKSVGMTVYAVYDEFVKDSMEEIIKIADKVIYSFKEAPLPC